MIKRWLAKNIASLDKRILYKMPDEFFLKMKYYSIFGETLDFKTPRGLNQKIQWIKLYDQNPLYTKLVDKYAVREYIGEKIGEEYLVPLLWVGERFDDIPFNDLPDRFVIKCNHDSGSTVICLDKINFDIKSARKKINRALKKNYYYPTREWQYKDVPPKIIIEEYLTFASDEKPNDYKFLCFNGEPKVIAVYSNLLYKKNVITTFFDTEWNVLPFKQKNRENHSVLPAKPKNFDKLIDLSKKLSQDAHLVRVDFFLIDDKIYFGEITLTHESGYFVITPPSALEWDKIMGDWLKLPVDK